MRSNLETPFAILTMATALLHFAGETYYHVLYGQPFPAYLVDLIAIGLMLLGQAFALRYFMIVITRVIILSQKRAVASHY